MSCHTWSTAPFQKCLVKPQALPWVTVLRERHSRPPYSSLVLHEWMRYKSPLVSHLQMTVYCHGSQVLLFISLERDWYSVLTINVLNLFHSDWAVCMRYNIWCINFHIITCKQQQPSGCSHNRWWWVSVVFVDFLRTFDRPSTTSSKLMAHLGSIMQWLPRTITFTIRISSWRMSDYCKEVLVMSASTQLECIITNRENIMIQVLHKDSMDAVYYSTIKSV